MGYTHYWDAHNFSDDEWEEMLNAFPRLEEYANVYIRYECDSSDPALYDEQCIRFNGVAEQGHETFLLEKNGGWEFCKTARKPYDLLVVAVLHFASLVSDSFSYRSDGTDDELAQGRTIAEKVYTKLEEQLTFDF